MTADERQLIRRLIDQTRRARLTSNTHTCSGCGCDVRSQTIGCKSCSDRHWRRRTRGATSWRTYQCEGCGCDYANHTIGCATCANRHAKRRRRKQAA